MPVLPLLGQNIDINFGLKGIEVTYNFMAALCALCIFSKSQ